jgi:hypothetical protein
MRSLNINNTMLYSHHARNACMHALRFARFAWIGHACTNLFFFIYEY